MFLGLMMCPPRGQPLESRIAQKLDFPCFSGVYFPCFTPYTNELPFGMKFWFIKKEL